MNNQYSFDGEFVEEGLMKIFPQKGKVRNGTAWYLRKIRKGVPIDPITGALIATPIPGSVVIANSYTKTVDPNTRARVVKMALERPDKALVRIVKGTPETAVKTVVNVPSSTKDFSMDKQDKIMKWAIKHGIEPTELLVNGYKMLPIK